MIAQGVSPGLIREMNPAPEGRKIPGIEDSVAPLGLIPQTQPPPTAHAVGYRLSALRACGWPLGRPGRSRGAEHRQTIAQGVSPGLGHETNPAPEGRKIPGGPDNAQSNR